MASLEKFIGSRGIYGFLGQKPEEPFVQKMLKYTREGLVGGVILFNHNVSSKEQIKDLCKAFQEAANRPFIIAIDQEGGKVQRLREKNGFTDYPSMKDVAAWAPSERQALAQKMARELREIGVNLNFTPVVDLHSERSKVIGQLSRAFSDRPEEVTACARDIIQGHRIEHVLTCVKHFPGHGLAEGDSHAGFVDVTHSFHQEELIPYKLLIEQKLVDMVMMAHVWNDTIDPHHPASLSHKTLKGLLRTQLGYEGVIICDDLHMGAILQRYGQSEALELALKAGNDMFIYSNNKAASAGTVEFEPDPDLPARVLELCQDGVQEHYETFIEDAYESTQRIERLLTQQLV